MPEISCNADDAPCDCLDTDLFATLGRKYALDVVCVVANHEPVRFGQIEDHVVGASTSTLSSRLDELEAAELVSRQRYDEIPPRVEYELTDDGRELGDRLAPVVEWIAARERGDEPNAAPPGQKSGKPDETPAGNGPPGK